jgi:hypothetical protein
MDNLTSGPIIVKKKDGVFRLLSQFDTCKAIGYTRQMKTLFLAAVICMFPVLVLSHPGKTDTVGGHKCYKDCEKWDLLFEEYHLHDKDGKPIRVARKVKKKREPRIVEESLAEPLSTKKTETPPLVQAAPITLPVQTGQSEESLSTSPLVLLLLALLLLFLLVRRRGRER